MTCFLHLSTPSLHFSCHTSAFSLALPRCTKKANIFIKPVLNDYYSQAWHRLHCSAQLVTARSCLMAQTETCTAMVKGLSKKKREPHKIILWLQVKVAGFFKTVSMYLKSSPSQPITPKEDHLILGTWTAGSFPGSQITADLPLPAGALWPWSGADTNMWCFSLWGGSCALTSCGRRFQEAL